MIEKKEVFKYLRTASDTDDPLLNKLIDGCIQKAYAAVTPKTIYAIMPVMIEGNTVFVAGIPFESARLAENLAGCEEAVVFAATLGTAADALLRGASAVGAASVMVYQAVLAAMIEEVCDNLEQRIVKTHAVTLRKRYSPGYFDLKIESQKDFFKLIDITKRIGVTLTDQMLMIPSKSVTAFIGIDHED